MSETIATSLSKFLGTEKKKYLVESREIGGTAEGFRERIRSEYARDKLKFDSLVIDALMEATTRKWQQRPRHHGPDLFMISGYTVPEYLTRPKLKYVDGEDIEADDEAAFEKVDSGFATVYDHFQDTQIHLRKAAQSSAAAERQAKATDEMVRRAKGRMDTPLRDIADVIVPPNPQPNINKASTRSTPATS